MRSHFRRRLRFGLPRFALMVLLGLAVSTSVQAAPTATNDDTSHTPSNAAPDAESSADAAVEIDDTQDVANFIAIAQSLSIVVFGVAGIFLALNAGPYLGVQNEIPSFFVTLGLVTVAALSAPTLGSLAGAVVGGVLTSAAFAGADGTEVVPAAALGTIEGAVVVGGVAAVPAFVMGAGFLAFTFFYAYAWGGPRLTASQYFGDLALAAGIGGAGAAAIAFAIFAPIGSVAGAHSNVNAVFEE